MQTSHMFALNWQDQQIQHVNLPCQAGVGDRGTRWWQLQVGTTMVRKGCRTSAAYHHWRRSCRRIYHDCTHDLLCHQAPAVVPRCWSRLIVSPDTRPGVPTRGCRRRGRRPSGCPPQLPFLLPRGTTLPGPTIQPKHTRYTPHTQSRPLVPPAE